MSIYHARRKPLQDAGQEPAEATGRGDAPLPEAAQPVTPPAPYLAPLRKATPVEYVLPASLVWLEGLPPQVRPVALTAKYARIVNLIAQQWNDYNACCAYFDELLKGRRGNRRGFPADVHREISTLRDHYQREYYRQLRQTTGGKLAIV